MKMTGIVGAGLGALLAVTAGCTSTTGPCETGKDVQGNWRYSAVVQAPLRATLTGTLSVTQQSCGVFSGSLNVVEVTSTGLTRQRSGPMNGKIIDASSLRFDVFLDADSRQHLASISGDSLSGTWVIVDPSGSSPSGTFSSSRSAAK